MSTQIEIPTAKIADFCRRHHIRKLAFFGSVLRNDFTPESDVDVLVEFEPGILQDWPSSLCSASCRRYSVGMWI